LRHLRAFLSVAEHGSTAAAARHLNLSQPAVSVAIRELEDELGQPLFQRLPARGLVPTSFGLEKLPEARALAASVAAFGSGGSGREPAGTVSFGHFSTLGPQYLPGILSRLARLHPRITVTPVEGDLEELERLLEAGRIELALTYDVRAGPRTVLERVAELTPHAVLPLRHRLAKEDAVPVAELAREPFVLIDLPSSRDFLLSVFRSEGIEPRIAYRARSLEMVYGMVANGLGVSVLVTRPASDRAYDGKRVVRVPLAGTRLRQNVVLAWPSWSKPTQPARALADCVRSYLAESG
jgi:DNA-binding transcriptional LysR family regulator